MLARALAWIDEGPFTSRDLGLYRIIYASISLLAMNQFSWLATLPSSFFTPLPGPFALASGFPSASVLTALEVILAIALVALLIGFLTPISSILVFIATIVGEGFSYSTGKIDHSILMSIVPLIMAFSRWGDSLSVDAMIRPSIRLRPTRQWTMRLLAICVGSAMMTAGLPKLYNGWLDPRTQASFGYQGLEYYSHDRQAGLADFLVSFDAPWFWEILDWSTVILECGLLFAVLSWRSWRVGLALFTAFHLGVMVALSIPFWNNIVTYGAFVSWSLLVPVGSAQTEKRRAKTSMVVSIAAVTVVLFGLIAWRINDLLGQDRMLIVAPIIVVIGFIFGAAYLLRQVWLLFRGGLRRRQA